MTSLRWNSLTVNVAGYVAENVLSGLVKQFHAEDLPEICECNDIVMLDVRSRGEFASGHFSRAINIPLDELRGRLDYLNRDVPVYVNCRSGTRSYIACRILSAYGFNCYNLAGTDCQVTRCRHMINNRKSGYETFFASALFQCPCLPFVIRLSNIFQSVFTAR